MLTILLLVVNVALLAGLAAVGWLNRTEPGARAFVVLQVVSAAWAGLTAVGLRMPPGPERLELWGITVGASLLTIGLWLAFILSYTGRGRWLAPRRFLPIALPLVVGAGIYAVAPGWPPLVGSVTQLTIPAGTVVESGIGPVGVVLGVYVYGVFLVGLALVVKTVSGGNALFAGQAVALVLGTLVTVLASVSRIAGIPTGGYPLTQVALGGQSLFWGYAVFRQQFLTRVPAVASIGERAVFDELDEGVLVVKGDGTVIRANPRARVYLDAEPLIGASIDALLEDVGVSDLPGRFQRGDRTYRAKASTVTNWRGVPVGRAVIIRDVSDLVRRRQRLEVLNRVLRHDIRNRMNVVLGQVGRLDPSAPEAERAVASIERKSTEIVELSRKARRIESLIDGETATDEPVALVPTVERICDSLQAEYPDAEVGTDLPERAPVLASELTDVAVRNVVENALEHNDAPEPRLDISVGRDGDRVTVRIADNGPGLPTLERKVIRQRSETPLQHSRGLGLWLATWIIDETDGEIGFTENEPRGTVITISLPSAPPDATTDAGGHPAGVSETTTGGVSPTS